MGKHKKSKSARSTRKGKSHPRKSMTIRVSKARELLTKGIDRLNKCCDKEKLAVLGDGILNDLVRAIAKPKGDESIYEYLMQNKNGLTLIALFHHEITLNYSIKAKVDGVDCFVSPHFNQLFDDGVMFLQGPKRFAGLIALYIHGDVKFAVAARDIRPGEQLGPKDFLFTGIDEFKKRSRFLKRVPKKDIIDEAIHRLEALLRAKDNNERHYQEYFEEFPWVFGAQYSKVQAHRNLDDESIPDFTAVRARDDKRDIIEVKPPFLSIFRGDGNFKSIFNDAWNQVERYLDFTRRQQSYLSQQKGLEFENPHCFLLAGDGLSDPQIKRLKAKEGMNQAITILTYNDVLQMIRNTVSFIRKLA